MIELDTGFFVFPEKISVIKSAGKGKCTVYTDGQGALDGFVLNLDALEAAQQVVDAIYGPEEE